MKIIKFIWDNIFFFFTIFFLLFIPLYPKLPLIDIKNTWVYVRVEDILVVFALFVWLLQLARGKINLKSPLTLSILVFWVIGAVATIHAVIIIFPSITNVYTNVALLSYLRHIEYLSLFFVAYSGMKEKKFLPYILVSVTATLIITSLYGIGQRYLGFPAFLTMNEEFAKGGAIQLSSQSRVSSTFAGHYDLAAYLVLIIPIIVSLIAGVKNWFLKLVLLGASLLGFIVLFMTVSRVSFFVLLLSLLILCYFYREKILVQKKILLIALIPLIIFGSVFLSTKLSQSLLSRFGNTVKEVDILVDTKTGADIGQIKKISSNEFSSKLILAQAFRNKDDLNVPNKNPGLDKTTTIVPFKYIPPEVYMVIPPDTPTGENLPQGTGYINLTLSPVKKRLPDFYYEIPPTKKISGIDYVTRYEGDFLIKRASAYDLSFTTRFQGEWPRTLEAFKRNIFFGSGYSSVSLAVDNNFLRLLGEVGILGFVSFFSIFLLAGIYMKKILPEVNSPVLRSFILGLGAGLAGLIMNALLIDVFEASKIAYQLWLLIGVAVGVLSLYQTKQFSIYKEFRNALFSPYAIIVYLIVVAIAIFSPMTQNYFVGDDFTWLRWAADCHVFSNANICNSSLAKISYYLTNSDGFFYRPGTRIYFFIMYSLFWLNQNAYHLVSLSLHVINAVLVFLFAKKVFKNTLYPSLVAFLFLILSGHLENVFWISSTGHLFSEMFVLLSLLTFIVWDEKKNVLMYGLSLLFFVFSLLFYEIGIVLPLFLLAYKYSMTEFRYRLFARNVYYWFYGVVLVLYFLVRYLSHSHWMNGDYSYNLLKLPVNTVGNALGYFLINMFGTIALPMYETLRNSSKGYIFAIVALIVFLIIVFVTIWQSRRKSASNFAQSLWRKLAIEERRIVVLGFLFFIVSLVPFLGLGNITSRYSYLSSIGFLIIFVLLLKKIYELLVNNGRDIAFASVTVILATFFLFHIIQLQQTYDEWKGAGERSQAFFTTMDSLYDDMWSYEKMKFHFVNVPIKNGDAWIFPVGLKDAVWFIFKNSNIEVYQDPSLDFAFDSIKNARTERVFEFNANGDLSEVRRIQTVKGIQIERKH